MDFNQLLIGAPFLLMAVVAAWGVASSRERAAADPAPRIGGRVTIAVEGPAGDPIDFDAIAREKFKHRHAMRQEAVRQETAPIIGRLQPPPVRRHAPRPLPDPVHHQVAANADAFLFGEPNGYEAREGASDLDEGDEPADDSVGALSYGWNSYDVASDE